MSAKWRALQNRHRYSYSAVIFPSSYIHTLSPLSSNPNSLSFFSQLSHFTSLTSIYSQVTEAKTLASSFATLLNSLHSNGKDTIFDGYLVELASRAYLELLFLENSLPLHRTLVSALSKISDFDVKGLIVKCFRELCDEYGGEKKGSKRFCLSRVALSMMGMQKLGFLVGVVEDCAVLISKDVVLGLEGVVLETQECARPSPIVLEQCQESLSCLYYLLQRFPGKFKNILNVFDGEELVFMNRVLEVLIRLLKSSAFSRDCFVAAGVSLCAALQVCLGAKELGLFISEGIFNLTSSSFSGNSCDGKLRNVILKIPFKSDLCLQIHSFSVLSRLCLIRGILTAVSRTVLNYHFVVPIRELDDSLENGNSGGSSKTILYDGILPELCHYCENPIDSHFNFHALTVLQICLQQMKTSILGNLTEFLDNYDPIPEEMGARILRIIWNNLEDPLSQTVKQVNLIFDLFLDVHSTLHRGEGSDRIKSFLQKISSDLLRLGPRCKGRYVPLASLTKRVGAKAMLYMCPTLLFETAQAYIDDDVCCAATNFLKCFLECLRDECWNINGVEEGYIVYRGYCLPPFLYGLASGVSKLRSNLNTYALSVLLDLDVDSVFPILAFISVGPSNEEKELLYPELNDAKLELGVEQKVAILVSLLKVCRSLAIIEGDIDFCDNSSQLISETTMKGKEIGNPHAVVCIKGIKFKVPVEWLLLALIHVDESLRVDAAETLFLNPKTSTLPSHLELTLLKEAVPLNMRSCSTGFQMKWTSLFRKFFSRVRTALDRYFKLGMWEPLKKGDDSKTCTSKGTDEAIFSRAEDLFNFMKWLCCFLFFSCYPSAPYKRKMMAMELILIMLNVWPLIPSFKDKSNSASSDNFVCPYSEGITSPESTLLLVGSIIDSWDRLRESSFSILLYFPTPLPGVSSDEMVQRVLMWAKKLVCSPRVRESDAGALTLRLIFRKYVLDLGWIVRASADVSCSRLQYKTINGRSQITESSPPVVEYIRSLIDWLNASVEEGERDLSEACKNSFVHGVLLALRYTFEELEWDSDAVMSCIPEIRLALENLLELVMRITSLALWVVSADAWYLQDMDEIADDDAYMMDEIEGDGPSLISEGTNNSKQVQDNRPTEQIVMVGCWLAMKEVSLLLGTIIRKIPLPTSCSTSLDSESNFSAHAAKSTLTAFKEMIDFKQLEKIGDHFLEVLLKMKHNGAIDKTRAGFTALCNRLLCSNDPRLCMLTESWMDQLMTRTVAKEQTVDDLLRRSAGIPAAFIALFLSEPEGSPKKLLPRALRWLIDVASSTLSAQVNADNPDDVKFSPMLAEETDSEQSLVLNTVEKNSKIRDEGVIPTVHAFNVLRASFNDTNLATDTSGFAAEALIISIRSFSSPYWEVRNSACLAYTALVRRMIGFLNVQKRESARRALTGLEFFHRYPSLHPFFYDELKVATDSLSNSTSGPTHPGSHLAKAVHPSLCPMLILLSRLKPSTIASESGDDLDPFLFMPFIRRCSTQSNLRIRVLASRALVSLVSNEKLQMVILNIASELHCVDNQINKDSFSSLSPTHCKSFNSIHGTLLQLSSLLDANCRNLADFTKKEKILGELIHILGSRSWIAKPKRCPCPILNASFLRVLDHMLSIARMGHMSENFYAIRDLLLELSTECLDADYSYELPYYDPTIAELREQAAMSYFSCVHEASKDEVGEILQLQQKHPTANSELTKAAEAETSISFPGLRERLISSLLDSSYEVRQATLKWLLKFFKSANSNNEDNHHPSHEIKIIQNWNKSDLQPMMMKLLESENHHRCMYYILKILVAWNSLQFQQVENDNSADIMYVGNLAPASVFQFWDKLVSMYKLTRHTKTRETLICCMAICMKYFVSSLSGYVLAKSVKKTVISCRSDELDNSIHLYEYVAFFVNLIKEHSSSSEQVTMRNAVAESIIMSGLLEQAELLGSSVMNMDIPSENPGSSDEPKDSIHVYACQVLETWFCCIKLLEDEDNGIRQRLASKVQRSFSSVNSRSKSSVGGVPTQVEKVIEQSFQHLSSVFGHWINYFDYLARWVLNATNLVVPSGDIVRRVFDKEIDNHHEEKLLICQICCSHLEKLPILQSLMADVALKHEFSKYLNRWRMRVFDQLMSFAKDYVRSLEGVEWMGGVGNHKDAFLPMYTNLLGFYALSNCILNSEKEKGMGLLSQVVQLGEVINTFLSNPMICNLYSLVVKSHEKYVGAQVELSDFKLIDNSVWDSFNPYFLLR